MQAAGHRDIGQRRQVEVSRAQKVWLERAAQALEELGVQGAHQEAAAVLREVVEDWRGAQAVPEDEEPGTQFPVRLEEDMPQ